MRSLLRALSLFAVTACLILSVSCAKQPEDKPPKQDQPQTNTDSTDINEPENTDPDPEPEKEQQPPEEKTEELDEVIEKITGASDENGIYTIVITLSDKAADKGTVEMVYYGAKGSAQENSVVNTFRIEYWKEADGKFEIRTFYDGEVYQNQHGKDAVKVNNTFGAALRAGSVAITYTPDGGESREIFTADAERFYVPEE